MNSFFKDFNRFAVVGLSRNSKSFSRNAYNFLKSEGYQLYPVNPYVDNIDGEKCYSSLNDVPDLEAAIFFTNSEASKELLPVCKDKGIQNIWFQFGSADEDTLAEAKKLGLQATKSCVFLHHPNSKFPHNIHRFINELITKQ